MTTVFNLCKLLISKAKAKGESCDPIIAKMDIYLANDRLTMDEYRLLMEMINA